MPVTVSQPARFGLDSIAVKIAPSLLLSCALLWMLQGCFAERTEHPLAVLLMDPSGVCVDDDFATVINLSAGDSQAKAHLPGSPYDPDHCITRVQWSVSGAAITIDAGQMVCEYPCPCETEGECEPLCPLAITLAGDHTATVTLEVHNELDESDLAIVPVALVAAQACTEDADCCSDDVALEDCLEVCEETPSGSFCAPAASCVDDAECPACFGCSEDDRCWHRDVLP